MLQGRPGRVLDRHELAGVAIILDVRKRLNDFGMSRHKGHPPADHVESLRKRVHLHPHLAGSVYLKKTQRRATVAQEDVGCVLHDDNLVRTSEVDDLAVESARGDCPGRAVGIVEHEQFGTVTNVGRNRAKLWIEAALFAQRQPINLASVVLSVRPGNRIAGHRHERHVSRINKSSRQHGQGRLGSDRMVDFLGRVERDAENLLHEDGCGLLERLNTVVGVAPVLQLIDLELECVAHERVGHVIVFADAEVEEPSFGVGLERCTLGAFDFLKLVDLRAFAILAAADALGKERLKPRVDVLAHGFLVPSGLGLFSPEQNRENGSTLPEGAAGVLADPFLRLD